MIDPITAIGLGSSVLQTGLGLFGLNSAQDRLDKLLAQRKAYKTPDEVYEILAATQNNAQSGYDASTLNYLTSEADRAFSATLGTAQRMGADPNNLSAVFDSKMQAMMKIGANNHALNMENFSRYLGALDTLAANKAAEQKSEQDILKDQIQAAAGDKATGWQNIAGGVNTAIGTLSANKVANLYTNDGVATSAGAGGLRRAVDASTIGRDIDREYLNIGVNRRRGISDIQVNNYVDPNRANKTYPYNPYTP